MISLINKIVALSRRVEALEEENKKLREVVKLYEKLLTNNKNRSKKTKELITAILDQYM